MTPVPALELGAVTVRWLSRAAPVLRGVSFALGPGERAALLGLNGSGKTSLLLAAVGVAPFEGTIRVAGIAVGPDTVEEVRRRVGFLFNPPEDQLLLPQAVDDVALALRRRGDSPREARRRAAQLLVELGLAEVNGQPLAELSHGQKRRVALAGALVAGPSLLLLDEPSAGLDPPGRRHLAHLLRGLPAAMLIATHDLEFATWVCRRFLLLRDGILAHDGADLDPVLSGWGEGPPPGTD